MSSPIRFSKTGSGEGKVILLHGFPMHQHVWDEFKKPLSETFTVYTPDLPGFGKSAILKDDFSLDDVAAVMEGWVKEHQLAGSVIVGHSMGGYVALSMVHRNPALYEGLILFHSTALPDAEEKKQSRTKVVEFVDQNGVLAFTSNFIEPLFADAKHPAIPLVKSITIEASAEAVKAYTKAMRDRSDRSLVLKNFGKPVALIGGESDKGIPAESLVQQGELSATIGVHVLEDCAHMGMFEKPAECQAIILPFVHKIFDRSARR